MNPGGKGPAVHQNRKLCIPPAVILTSIPHVTLESSAGKVSIAVPYLTMRAEAPRGRGRPPLPWAADTASVPLPWLSRVPGCSEPPSVRLGPAMGALPAGAGAATTARRAGSLPSMLLRPAQVWGWDVPGHRSPLLGATWSHPLLQCSAELTSLSICPPCCL